MIFDFGHFEFSEDEMAPRPPRRRWGWGAGLEFVLTLIAVSIAGAVIAIGLVY